MRDCNAGPYAGVIHEALRQCGGEAMRDDLDDRLHDAVALDEIDLYADLLGAVAEAEGPLTPEQIDAALGIGQQSPAVNRRQE